MPGLSCSTQVLTQIASGVELRAAPTGYAGSLLGHDLVDSASNTRCARVAEAKKEGMHASVEAAHGRQPKRFRSATFASTLARLMRGRQAPVERAFLALASGRRHLAATDFRHRLPSARPQQQLTLMRTGAQIEQEN